MERKFKWDGSVRAKAWALSLTPKQAAFAKILAHVELSGDQYVRRVVLDEANGDRTTIVFRGQLVEPAKLTAEEAARFD